MVLACCLKRQMGFSKHSVMLMKLSDCVCFYIYQNTGIQIGISKFYYFYCKQLWNKLSGFVKGKESFKIGL